MRVVNADALSMKLRHMGYMDDDEEVQEVIDRFTEECDGDSISREYLKEHIEACWINGRPRHAPELNELLSWVNDVPSAEPEIIYCKDCKKHNMSHGHYYNGKYIGVKECCPLIFVRGLAQGHEFDYQFCAFGERRTDG